MAWIIDQNSATDNSLNKLYEILNNYISDEIPLITYKERKFPQFFSLELKRNFKEKKAAYWSTTCTDINLVKYYQSSFYELRKKE